MIDQNKTEEAFSVKGCKKNDKTKNFNLYANLQLPSRGYQEATQIQNLIWGYIFGIA